MEHLVARTRPQHLAQVGPTSSEQAGVDRTLGRKANSGAVTTERLGDRGDDEQSSNPGRFNVCHPALEWHADLAPLVMVSDRRALRVELTEAPHGRVQRGEDPMRPIDSPAPAKKIGNRPPCSVVNVSRNRTPSPRRSRRDNFSRRRPYLRPTLRRVAVWG